MAAGFTTCSSPFAYDIGNFPPSAATLPWLSPGLKTRSGLYMDRDTHRRQRATQPRFPRQPDTHWVPRLAASSYSLNGVCEAIEYSRRSSPGKSAHRLSQSPIHKTIKAELHKMYYRCRYRYIDN